MYKKNVLIYGATGSIGDSVLNLIRNNKNNFNVVGLTCNSNIDKLIKISNEFDCNHLGINNDSQIENYPQLKDYNIYSGLNEFSNLMNSSVDIIIFAIAGSSAINLLMNIATSGKIIGLANKECIICLGKSLLDIASKSSTKIVPLDSEHNAIFQLIKNKNKDAIRKYTITASGGSFYNFEKTKLKTITPNQATFHPKWKMGKKITVDSSTLMNKGLEIIEACILFDLEPNRINALIHPESIVHGMIEFNDRSCQAFLSQPSMEISISSVLFDNNSIELESHNLDLTKIKTLNFFEIDDSKFNAIKLAKISLNEGGLVPAVLNYANELMVELFLNNQVTFNEITEKNELIMNKFILEGNNVDNPNLTDIHDTFKIIDQYFSYNDVLQINR